MPGCKNKVCGVLFVLFLLGGCARPIEQQDDMWTECHQVLNDNTPNDLGDRVVEEIKKNIEDQVTLEDDPGTIFDEDAGYVEGLKDGIQRDDDASLTCTKKGVLQLQIPLAFKGLHGKYDWESKGSLLSGQHQFTIDKVTVTAHFSVLPVPNAKLTLDTFDSFTVGHIEKEITGMGVLNWFASKLSTFYGNNLSRSWRRLLQPPIETAVNATMSKTILDFPGVMTNDV